MLAAPIRRAARPLWGFCVVAAVSAGLTLAPTPVNFSPAHAQESSSGTIEVQVFPTAGTSVGPGEDFGVTVSIVNNSADALPAGEIVVTTGSPVLASASALDEWLAATDEEQQPGRWLGVLAAPAVAAGTAAEVNAVLPLSNALFGNSWGPRGLAADLEVAGESVGSGRGVLVWTPEPTPGASATLVTLLPIVTPALSSGLLDASALSLLTAPQGFLSAQLAHAAGKNVVLAVDPRITASILALGSDAPESAISWLARLRALPNESFALAYADADVALQAQSGASQLLNAGFSDLPALLPPEAAETTPTPASTPPTPTMTSSPSTGEPEPSPSTDPLVADSQWSPTLTGVTWPAENTVISSDLAVFGGSGSTVSILASTNVASGADSPARSAIDTQSAILSNSGLSKALRNASSATTDAQWGASFSLASAYLAATAVNPTTSFAAVAGLAREADAATSVRLSQTLDRVAGLPWVVAGSLATAIASSPSTSTTVVDKPESEKRVQVGKTLLARHAALASFATAVATPATLTDPSTRQELALFSLEWRANDFWEPAVSTYLSNTQETLNSIRIVTSSPINMVGGQANIPVTIENGLPLPVTLLVRATPSNARLTVDSDETITLQAEAQGKALVPVKARVGNGSVSLTVSLYSPSGVALGTPASLPVNVRADWETWGLGGLGVIFAVLLVAGVIRTVTKRRNPEEVLSP
jgi:hypothetical protein